MQTYRILVCSLSLSHTHEHTVRKLYTALMVHHKADHTTVIITIYAYAYNLHNRRVASAFWCGHTH